MERLRLLTLIGALTVSSLVAFESHAQRIEVIQTVTADAIINATATVVISTGTNIDLTLPASPGVGRSIQIVNHGVGDLLLSAVVKVSTGSSFDAIPASPNEFRPYISTNSITILWDGTNWRLIGY